MQVRQTNKQTSSQIDRQRDRDRDRETETETETETDRQTQTDRQTYRQTDRQTHRHTHIHIYTHRNKYAVLNDSSQVVFSKEPSLKVDKLIQAAPHELGRIYMEQNKVGEEMKHFNIWNANEPDEIFNLLLIQRAEKKRVDANSILKEMKKG